MIRCLNALRIFQHFRWLCKDCSLLYLPVVKFSLFVYVHWYCLCCQFLVCLISKYHLFQVLLTVCG